jgi:hypothetical protein
MSRKLAVRALFIAAVAVLLWGLSRVGEEPAPDTRLLPPPRPEPGEARPEPTEQAPSETILVVEQAPARTPLPEDSGLPGEFLLRFPSLEAYEAFLAEARRQGVTVLGFDPRLRTVRLAGEPADFGPWYDQYAEDAEPFVNVPVTIPRFPDDGAAPEFGNGGSGAQAYGNSALAAMGVDPDNSLWGGGVLVAVLDTALGYHPSLEGVPVTYVQPQPAGATDPGPTHATSVASLIVGNGAFAIDGIAPGAELLSVPVLDAEGNGDAFTLATGIVEAVDAGAQVINMSLGAYAESPVLQDAVTYAADRGVVLVAAAGNDGVESLLYPAAYPEVLAVGAADVTEHTAYFSNYGQGLDLVAPGVGVYAAGGGDSAVFFSGSSASAPYVSGAIAGLMSLDPNLTATEAARLLTLYPNDTGPPGADRESGSGFVNVGTVNERETPGIHDVAVADIFVDRALVNVEGTEPLVITVQNRGTESFERVQLVSSIDGVEGVAEVENLGPGQTIAVPFDVDSALLFGEEGIRVEAVALPGPLEDARPDNNARATQLRLVEIPSEGGESAP